MSYFGLEKEEYYIDPRELFANSEIVGPKTCDRSLIFGGVLSENQIDAITKLKSS